MKKTSYTGQDLENAFKSVGISKDDIVMVHSGLSRLGALMQGVTNADELSAAILKALQNVIGPNGTIVVPTFTYSLGSGEIYDPQTTPCPLMGQFSEYFWRLLEAKRSLDPFLSVAAIGPMADELTKVVANTSFGKDSFFDRFTKIGGGTKLLTIGVELRWATILHAYEEEFKVPHRYNKFFVGKIRKNSTEHKISWIYNVRPYVSNAYPTFKEITDKAIKQGIIKTATIGKGIIHATKTSEYRDFALKEFKKNPWITAAGPKCDLVKAEKLRTGEQKFDINLKSTDIHELADKLYNLPRDLVSDGYDAAINAIKNKFKSIKILSYPSGTKAFTWIVPERWICHNAGLYDTDGNEIFSTKQNGLHVMRYSLPLDKEVSRKELFEHLHTPGKWANGLQNSVPYNFKFYERDWGLCCSNEQKSRLNDERYYVKIDSATSYGELKVGEWHIQGKSNKTIVFCAHLDHPYQFNDDLSGVIAGLKIMESLAKHKELRYSYKLLILPETIGSACYLSQNEKEIKDMIGGIFLEILSVDQRLHLMHSNNPNSYLDSVADMVFKQHNLGIADFGAPGQFLNDERMFNALNIPMMSIQRLDENSAFYPQYHTDKDTPKNANLKNLDLAIKFILNLIDIVENDAKFIRNFKGELFVSSVDQLEYSKDSRYIRELTFCNEENLSQIAVKKNLDFKELLRVAQILKEANLAKLQDVRL